MKSRALITFLIVMQACAFSAHAAPMRIYSTVTNSLNDVSYDAAAQAVRTGSLNIVLHVSCFGTNLRNVAYPLAASSVIEFTALIDNTRYVVTFPASITQAGVYKGTILDPTDVVVEEGPSGTTGSSVGNTVYIRANQSILLERDTDGNYYPMDRANLVKLIEFMQLVPVNSRQAYRPFRPHSAEEQYALANQRMSTGRSGLLGAIFSLLDIFSSRANAGGGGGRLPPVRDLDGITPDENGGVREVPAFLTSKFSYEWSTDFRTLEINATFPGERGFCGSYVSPLMLFFDDRRPEFNNTSEFNLGYKGVSHWPEPDAPGYFLAIDRNGDGLINDISELFGSPESTSNGFEVLRELDSNDDFVINKKDPAFSKLLLWNDKNGDGISQPNELFTLRQKGVTSISLRYTKATQPVSYRAELRERATFIFYKGKRRHTGEIVDVWFSRP